MPLTLQSQLCYIPFSEIRGDDSLCQFRLKNTEADLCLEEELVKWGQLHPLTVEEMGFKDHRILDGHRRYEAVARIREKGAWEKLLVQIIPPGSLSVHDRFQLIRDKNMRGNNPFGLYEKGLFLKTFLTQGLTIAQMAQASHLSFHEIEDHIELALLKPPLASLFNAASLPVTLAVMLFRRAQGWLKTSYAHNTELVIKKLIHHAAQEPLTIERWRFLMDFYWDGERPFMAAPLKPT